MRGPAGTSRPGVLRLLRACASVTGLVALAFLLRVWPLGATGTRFPWLTFYPAVMAVAVLEGFWAGAAAALLSAGVVAWLWPWVLGIAPIRDGADLVGLGVFVLNGLLIALIAEGARRQRRRAEAARHEAERANAAKSAFLASMSHELRTPMNAILGFSRMLQRNPGLDPAARRDLELVQRSGEHLLSLINDVLDMARVESGSLALAPSRVDLPALARECVGMLEPAAARKGLDLVLELRPDCPVAVLADGTRLRQVLVNLLGNAVRYTETGSVRLEAGREPSGRVRLGVSDTGPGIPPQERERIFEPFVQLEGRADRQGTGLGLAIARRLVGLMGGSIRVEAAEGGGACFTVLLPLETLDGPGETAEGGPILGVTPPPATRILVAEDQAENRELLCRLMRDSGFEVRSARDGREAVRAFEDWEPHFVWMDVRMPGMDGLEAARRIRALGPRGRQAKLVALTASVFPEERERVLAAGMDDFLRKPASPHELFACLALHLALPVQREVRREPPVLDRALLESLDPDLRRELRGALLSLDRERVAGAVARIARVRPEAAEALEAQARALAYSRILMLLGPGDEEKA